MLTNTRNVRIEWGDCDPAGIIFYPRYFEIFDASTAAVFERALGVTKLQMFKRDDFAGFPLARTQARFLKPTRFGDDVTVETTIAFGGRSSFEIEHRLSLERRDLRGMLGDTSVGGARRARRAEVASGAGRRCRRSLAPERHPISAAIFFKIWINRLRSRRPMMRRGCVRAGARSA